MAKPTIVTRAGKGSALTWTEGDANVTNLQNATFTLEAGTGGTDVVSDLNGLITLVAGTNVTISGDNTAKTVTVNASGGASTLDDLTDVVITAAATNDVLVYNGTNWVDTQANTLTVSAASTATTAATATNVTIVATGADTTMYPVVVGALSGSQIPYADIDFKWDASANILVAPTVNATNFNGIIGATTAAAGTFTTLSASGVITSTVATGTAPFTVASTTQVANLSAATAGTATTATTATGATNINISTTNGNAADTTMYPVLVGAASTGNQLPHIDSAGITYNASTNALTASLFAGALNGTVGATTPNTGAFTTVTVGTITLDDVRETIATVTYAATITPDVANGTVQKVTLTGNVTFSAFANPVAGQSLTLFVIQDGTGSRTLTSTMKFSGASKTLSTAASSVDIITVFYDGTSYYASLAKGFA
jgi:hypothetical protein